MANNDDQFFVHFPNDISDEIRNYATEEVLSWSRYLFTHREGRHQYAFCTHCKREHKSDGLKHGKKAECPLCGSAAYIKASGRGRSALIDQAYLLWYEKSVLDPQTIIARGFYLVRDYTKDYRKTETEVRPIALYVFEWGYGGKMAHRCYWRENSLWDFSKAVHSEAVNSMKNIPCYWAKHSARSAVSGTPFQYCTWEEYDVEDQVKVFDFAAKYPCLEYLTKLGMEAAVSNKLQGGLTFGAINWRGKTIDKVLRLTKAEAKEWVKQPFKSGMLSLFAYQYFKKIGLKLNFEQAHQVCQLTREGERKLLHTLSRHSSLEAIVKYVIKQLNREPTRKWYYDASRVLGDWKDYLAECKELGMDLSQDGVLFPNDLHEAHQKTSAKIKYKRDAELNAKIISRSKELNKQFRFEHNGFLIRAVASNPELFQEGKALNHCVGGYAQRYAIGQTDIFAIRRLEQPNTPFYTMEVNNGKVIQCRGFKNCDMTPEVKAVVEMFITQKLNKKKQVRVKTQNQVVVAV